MSAEEYYAANAEAIAAGTHTESYSDYFAKIQDEKTEFDKVAAYGETGAIAAEVEGWDEGEDYWFDLTLKGANDTTYTDTEVETGKKATNQDTLDELFEATKTDSMDKDDF